VHETLGGAFPKRHHVDCGVIAIICKVPVLGRYNKLMGKVPEEKVTHRKERRKEEFKRKSSRNESSESSGDERRQKWKEDARNIIAQA
jgi:hypothetical protein